MCLADVGGSRYTIAYLSSKTKAGGMVNVLKEKMVHNTQRHDKAAEPLIDLSAHMRHLAQLAIHALRSLPYPAIRG